MNQKLINQYKYLSFVGLIGFVGLVYFIDKDTRTLFYFAYFAFLAFFLMYKYLQKGIDERTLSNLSKANRVTSAVALTFLFLLGAVPALIFREIEFTSTFFILGSAVGTFCTILTQIGVFFYFEKR